MINVMSENTYRDVFNYDFNMEFFKRMKDRCDVCAAYQNLGDEKDARTEADYKEHIALKESSRIFKDNVKTRLKDEPTLAAAVFDLQEVLQTQHGTESHCYYKRKLNTYDYL